MDNLLKSNKIKIYLRNTSEKHIVSYEISFQLYFSDGVNRILECTNIMCIYTLF